MSYKSDKNHSSLKNAFRTSVRLIALAWSIDKVLLSIAIIATIVPSIVPFINIYIYKLIIDIVVAAIQGSPLNYTNLAILLGIRILTYFFQDASWRTQEYVERLFWTKLPIHLDEIIFKKISQLDIQYFEDSNFKDLLEKVRDNYFYRPQQVISSLIYSLQSAVQLLIAFFALIQLNWIFLIVIVLVAIPEFLNQAKQSELAWGVWAGNAPYKKRYWYLSNLLQNAQSLKELRIFQLNPTFIKEIKHVDTKFYNENKTVLKKNYFLGIGLNAVSTLIFVGIEIYIVLQAIARQITVGDISFYTGVVTNFQQGLSGLFRNVTNVFENTLYIQSIFELLDAKPILKPSPHPVILHINEPPLIEFRNVTFTYPTANTKVLDNFSLTIHPKEKIALVGENGAGKSTIIKLLARFYDVDSGEILINGVNIKDLDLKTWYQHLGILFQDFNRYEDLVKENIRFGRVEKDINQEKIKEAAISAGANEVIKKFKKGYEQMLGTTFENGQDLSTGQWQKIALARAFFRNAEILILDEPTASMDAKAESEIFERVKKLSTGKSVIIISHRFSTVRYADRIIVLKDGEILEQGNHQTLMTQKSLYAELFILQAKGYK